MYSLSAPNSLSSFLSTLFDFGSKPERVAKSAAIASYLENFREEGTMHEMAIKQ